MNEQPTDGDVADIDDDYGVVVGSAVVVGNATTDAGQCIGEMSAKHVACVMINNVGRSIL